MERKENNYPIKYAVMGVVIKTGWYQGTIADIASKCYVIGENKEYLEDGSSKTKFEVVFPFKINQVGNSFVLADVKPQYNIYFECINSVSVDQIYDDFDAASKKAEEYNTNILASEIGYLPVDSNLKKMIEEKKQEHQITLAKYKKMEKAIAEKTKDMEVTKSSNLELERIIDKIISSPEEFYIDLVRSLPPKEKEYLTQLIKDRNCSNCTNSNCIREESKKETCPIWNNEELIVKQFVRTRLGI